MKKNKVIRVLLFILSIVLGFILGGYIGMIFGGTFLGGFDIYEAINIEGYELTTYIGAILGVLISIKLFFKDKKIVKLNKNNVNCYNICARRGSVS